MADEAQTRVEATAAVEEQELVTEAPQTNSEVAATVVRNLKLPEIDFNDPDRESLTPRSSRDGKVFTNGFNIPGFSGMTDLPGKVCIDCGFSAMKFSTACPKCGGDLTTEK